MNTPSSSNTPPDDANRLKERQLGLEIRKLRLENRKLALEIRKSADCAPRSRCGCLWQRINEVLPSFGWIVTIAGLWVSFYQWNQSRKDAINEERLEWERAAATPFLNEQFKLYLEAVQMVAIISTTKIEDPRRKSAEQRFWELYWGPLAAVEDAGLRHQKDGAGEVKLSHPENVNKGSAACSQPPPNPIEKAMVAFGSALREYASSEVLQRQSLALAHAVRSSTASEFGVQSAKETKDRLTNFGAAGVKSTSGK
jgi:hypothetical protein